MKTNQLYFFSHAVPTEGGSKDGGVVLDFRLRTVRRIKEGTLVTDAVSGKGLYLHC